MKDPFYIGAIIRNPVTGVMARIAQPPNGDRLWVQIINDNLLFDVPATEWDLIAPRVFFEDTCAHKRLWASGKCYDCDFQTGKIQSLGP